MSMVWLDPDLISFIPLYSNTKPGCKAPVTCPDLSILVSLETISTPAQSPRFCSSCLSCLHHHVIPESRSLLIYNGCLLPGRLQVPELFGYDMGYILVFKFGVAFKFRLCVNPSLDGALQAHYAVFLYAWKRHTRPGCHEHCLDTFVTCGCSE